MLEQVAWEDAEGSRQDSIRCRARQRAESRWTFRRERLFSWLHDVNPNFCFLSFINTPLVLLISKKVKYWFSGSIRSRQCLMARILAFFNRKEWIQRGLGVGIEPPASLYCSGSYSGSHSQLSPESSAPDCHSPCWHPSRSSVFTRCLCSGCARLVLLGPTGWC